MIALKKGEEVILNMLGNGCKIHHIAELYNVSIDDIKSIIRDFKKEGILEAHYEKTDIDS
jgi:transposase